MKEAEDPPPYPIRAPDTSPTARIPVGVGSPGHAYDLLQAQASHTSVPRLYSPRCRIEESEKEEPYFPGQVHWREQQTCEHDPPGCYR